MLKTLQLIGKVNINFNVEYEDNGSIQNEQYIDEINLFDFQLQYLSKLLTNEQITELLNQQYISSNQIKWSGLNIDVSIPLGNILQAKADAVHTHTKQDITDFEHTHTKQDIIDFEHTHTGQDITDQTQLNQPNTIVKRDESGNFEQGTIKQNLDGNQKTQDRLKNQRAIKIEGQVVGDQQFDGSSDVSIVTNVNHDHDDKYYTKNEVNTLIEGIDAENQDTLDGYHAADFQFQNHTHDDRYYTKIEIDGLISNVDQKTLEGHSASDFQPFQHNHNDLYYTKLDIDQYLQNKQDAAHTHTISDITDLSGLNISDQDTLDGYHAADFQFVSHNHDEIYYRKTEIDTMLSGLSIQDADTLDGIDSTQFVRNDVDSTINANLTVTGSIHGVQDEQIQQNKLQTQVRISLVGDVVGNTTFDGSSDVSINQIVANDSHIHSDQTILTVDWSKLLNRPASDPSQIDDQVEKQHVQNTDIGTTNQTFYIGGDTGLKLKNSGGTLELRNQQDTDYQDLVVRNLTVEGNALIIQSEIVQIADNTLVLNSNYTGDQPTENQGFEVERGTLTNQSLIWDESNDLWKQGLQGQEKTLVREGNTVELTGQITGSQSFGSDQNIVIETFQPDYALNEQITNYNISKNVLTKKTGLLIPYYIYPYDSTAGDWKTETQELVSLLKQYNDIPQIVIVNPSDSPGTYSSTTYTRFIRVLYGQGQLPSGYIWYGIGLKDINDVYQDIDQWRNYYPDIKSLFIDGIEYDVDVARLNSVIDYARDKGFIHVIINPGTLIPGEKFNQINADLIVVHENSYYDLQSDYEANWSYSYKELSKLKRAGLVSEQTIFNPSDLKQFAKQFSYVWVTETYSSWPAYAQDVFTTVEFINSGEGSGLDQDTVDGKHASDFADSTLTNVQDSVILSKIKNVDGENSGLDADTIDGQHQSEFQQASHTHQSQDITDQTQTNTANTLVKRDQNGDFSQGTITQNLNGNQTSQDKLSQQRTIQLTGDVSGSANFDGSQNVTITQTVQSDSHTHSNQTITSLDQSKITSGTLSIQRGGTNNTTYTSNKFLIYDGTKIQSSSYDQSSFQQQSHNHDSVYVNVSGDTMTGILTVPSLQINDSNTKILEGAINSVRIQTNSGYIDIGPANTSYAHYVTDRPYHWFNKTVFSNGDFRIYSGGVTDKYFNQTSFNFPGGTINGTLKITGDLDMDEGTIYYVRQIRFDWTSRGYNQEYHAIVSKNAAASLADAIRLNSYGDVIINIDSNNNGSNTFSIYKHGGIGQIDAANRLFYVDENGYQYATKIYGAVYNDYQEYRIQDEDIEPGYVAVSTEKGTVKKCDKDRQKNVAGVVSDVFGFQIGEVDGKTNVPIQVAGRALVYQKNRDKLKLGEPVVQTKDGMVRRLKWYEKLIMPWIQSQIVGYVDEIPEYDIWGRDNIKVNNRVWIRVK